MARIKNVEEKMKNFFRKRGFNKLCFISLSASCQESGVVSLGKEKGARLTSERKVPRRYSFFFSLSTDPFSCSDMQTYYSALIDDWHVPLGQEALLPHP